MNLNKLFKHLNIQVKLMIAFILLSTIPLLLVGGYGIYSKIASLKEIAVRNVNHDVTTIREKIAGFLSHVENDLRFLASSYHFRSFIRAMAENDEAAIELLLPMVKEEFLTFLQSKKIYYQIRYLDKIGVTTHLLTTPICNLQFTICNLQFIVPLFANFKLKIANFKIQIGKVSSYSRRADEGVKDRPSSARPIGEARRDWSACRRRRS